MGAKGPITAGFKKLGSSIDQVLLLGHAWHLGNQGDLIAVIDTDQQLIPPIEDHKQGLQFMIAIRATAIDVQK